MQLQTGMYVNFIEARSYEKINQKAKTESFLVRIYKVDLKLPTRSILYRSPTLCQKYLNFFKTIIKHYFQAQDSVFNPATKSSTTPGLKHKHDFHKSASAINLTTPRILELDINRVMFPQNLIS